MLDLALIGGTVVTPEGPALLDVGVADGRIAMLSAPGTLPEATETLDCTGKLVLPGGVDPHVHTNAPYGMPNVLGRDIIGKAALYGGMTTFIDFVWPGIKSPLATVQDMVQQWEGTSYTNYGFHVVLSDQSDDAAIAEIGEIVEQGFPSFKIFTTDITPTDMPGFRTSGGTLWEIMAATAKAGGIVDIHAEDDELVMHQYRKHFEAGKTDIVYMPDVHTTISEDLAFHHVLRMASHIPGSAVYLHHVTAKLGVDALRWFRAKGVAAYGETLAVLSMATADRYAEPDGHKYHIYPSLKFDEDVEAIWDGVADGTIHTSGTDGVCCLWEEKNRARTIDGTFGGVTGVEPKLALFYTEMVHRRGMGLKKLVELTAENAAKIFGLYPRKGAILVGSDADFAVLDPTARRVLDPAELHEGDYTPWNDRVVEAWPAHTVLGGRVVVRDGVMVDEGTHGQLLLRRLDPAVALGKAV
ncbi:dihydroorotase [Nakamurella leprariae]|uniref:Amidohydrolase family protein n=1 Tax=Nakamurella leprariae TaxID=2803911 RepID=A0A938Y9W0_9ACTN|nr:amidohydrolase family protein [Nakamurella leprariae]MBM9465859.1 amidohydrolase family protein [Nakamurella leprariae]